MDNNLFSGDKRPSSLNQSNDVKKIIEGLNKEYVVIGKARVKPWHSWLFLGAAVGVFMGVLLVTDRNAEFIPSSAEIVVPETPVTLTNDFLDVLNAYEEVKDVPDDFQIEEENQPQGGTIRLLNYADAKTVKNLKKELVDEMVKRAQRRKQVLERVVKSKPGEVLKVAIPKKVRNRLPEEVKPYIEEETAASGEFQALHVDYLNDSAEFLYFINTEKGEALSLYFAEKPPHENELKNKKGIVNGSRVRVNGMRVGGAMALESTNTGVQVLSLVSSATFGPQNTLLILVNFQNNVLQPYTVDYAKNLLFTTTSNFMKENSYGQTTIVGGVAGWFTIPMNDSGCKGSALAENQI